MTEPRLTVQHLRQLKYCPSGAKAWCERHGLDWRALVQDGLPISQIEAIDDAFAVNASQLVREEHGRQ